MARGHGHCHLVRMMTLLLILLVLALVGAVPAWPHSRSWGYYPSGGIGLILLVVLILFFTGSLHI